MVPAIRVRPSAPELAKRTDDLIASPNAKTQTRHDRDLHPALGVLSDSTTDVDQRAFSFDQRRVHASDASAGRLCTNAGSSRTYHHHAPTSFTRDRAPACGGEHAHNRSEGSCASTSGLRRLLVEARQLRVRSRPHEPQHLPASRPRIPRRNDLRSTACARSSMGREDPSERGHDRGLAGMLVACLTRLRTPPRRHALDVVLASHSRGSTRTRESPMGCPRPARSVEPTSSAVTSTKNATGSLPNSSINF